MTGDTEEDVVLNVVWTGSVFTYLRWFVASQLLHSRARFRFIVNSCPPEQVALMERFAAAHPGRVVEIYTASDDRMVRHGDCLDAVLADRDDGELFGLVDPDIRARGPFVRSLLDLLAEVEVVTSGTEVWTESNVLPEGQLGVSGEYFYDRDGYTFGSPHLALYRREALDDTIGRWAVGFSSAGNDLRPDAVDRLRDLGRSYMIYDTGKLMNIFLQGDGHRLVHQELDDVVHIGGLAHHLHPTGYTTGADGEVTPDWSVWDGMASRAEVSRFTADVLRALVEDRPAPEVPPGLEAGMADRLGFVRAEVASMVEECRPLVEAT